MCTCAHVCARMCACMCVHVSMREHANASVPFVWKSEDNLRCWFSLSTLFGMRPLVLFTAVQARLAGSHTCVSSLPHPAVSLLVGTGIPRRCVTGGVCLAFTWAPKDPSSGHLRCVVSTFAHGAFSSALPLWSGTRHAHESWVWGIGGNAEGFTGCLQPCPRWG